MSNRAESLTYLRVKRVVTEADLRLTRRLTTDNWEVFENLGRGQVVALVNRTCKILRFVDCERGLHTFYARAGEVYDTDRMIELAKDRMLAVGLSLVQGKAVKQAPEPGLSLRPVKRKRKAKSKTKARRVRKRAA